MTNLTFPIAVSEYARATKQNAKVLRRKLRTINPKHKRGSDWRVTKAMHARLTKGE